VVVRLHHPGRRLRQGLLLLLLAAALPRPAAAQGLVSRLEGSLRQVQDLLGQTFSRSVPLPSASAGVSYVFDPATGNFQREPATFGQVYLDRADTLGARRVNVSFAYQFVELDEIGGQEADDLRDPTPIPLNGRLGALAFDQLRLEGSVHQFLFALTYGLTEDLDVSVAVPIEYSNLFVGAKVRAAAVSSETMQLERATITPEEAQHPLGVGDLMLRAKYRVLERRDVDVAAGLLLRIPTGTESDLQGLGFLEVTPSLLASTRVFEPAPWARLQGHVNAGVGFDTDDVGASEARWGIGLDWNMTEHVTAAVAFLGQNQFARVAPPGFFDFRRCPNANLVTCATTQSVRDGNAPLFGLSGDRPDYYDFSVGGRGAVWRDTVFLFANLVVPLNDGAVRTRPIPLIGVEATF
jgi:hypothetical protein